MRNYIACIAFLTMLSGCTRDFELYQIDPPSLYVIDGRISSMWGPYYVRVTKSAGLVAPPGQYYYGPDGAEAVKGAFVVITDDTGIRDTLIPAPTTIERYRYFFPDSAQYQYDRIDSVYTTMSFPTRTYERGYYQTTKIKGQAGHTYQLEVQVGNNIFRSSAYMPAVATLDRAEYRDTTLSPFLNTGDVRVAYFKDPPNEKNYYMLTGLYSIYGYRYDYFLTPDQLVNHTVNQLDYYVFDDKLLGSEENAVPVWRIGFSYKEPYYAYEIPAPWPRPVRLQSLTREAYDYFNILSKQLSSDGNVFKPAPAAPKGNISGGALGLFYATDVSAKLAYPNK